MKKLLAFVGLILLLGMNAAFSDSESFDEAKRLVDSGIKCVELSDDQLEMLGDYSMEKMHPGEAHELMDAMMGGEGSETLRQMHITMARNLYCGEEADGMMGMMNSKMIGSGMMNGEMMNMAIGSGMMGGFGSGFGYWGFLTFLYTLLLLGLTILVYLWILKLWRGLFPKKK